MRTEFAWVHRVNRTKSESGAGENQELSFVFEAGVRRAREGGRRQGFHLLLTIAWRTGVSFRPHRQTTRPDRKRSPVLSARRTSMRSRASTANIRRGARSSRRSPAPHRGAHTWTGPALGLRSFGGAVLARLKRADTQAARANETVASPASSWSGRIGAGGPRTMAWGAAGRTRAEGRAA